MGERRGLITRGGTQGKVAELTGLQGEGAYARTGFARIIKTLRNAQARHPRQAYPPRYRLHITALAATGLYTLGYRLVSP